MTANLCAVEPRKASFNIPGVFDIFRRSQDRGDSEARAGHLSTAEKNLSVYTTHDVNHAQGRAAWKGP